MTHPPYSPDEAPSDFYVFPNLKQQLRGHCFENEKVLHNACDAALRLMSKDGIWLLSQMESTSKMKKTWLKNIKKLKFCNKNPETLVALCTTHRVNDFKHFSGEFSNYRHNTTRGSQITQKISEISGNESK